MPRVNRSFRLDSATAERLEARADELGETRTSLAERYIEEGSRMDEHPGIVFLDGSAGRRPTVAGSGLDVWEVIETLKASNNSVEEAAEYLDVPAARVRIAVRYYAAFKGEVDEWIERIHEIAAREEEAWKREQAVLA